MGKNEQENTSRSRDAEKVYDTNALDYSHTSPSPLLQQED